MAKAPPVGIGKRMEAQAQAKRLRMKVILGDDSWVFNPQNLPFGVEKKVRRAGDGRPFLGYMTDVGVDSMKVCVWVARMVNGEPDLTIDEVDAAWPDDLDGFDMDEVDLDVDDDPQDEADPNG